MEETPRAISFPYPAKWRFIKCLRAKKGNRPPGIPLVHRTQHLRRGEAHGNYPLILFISGRGYITARWGKGVVVEEEKGREGGGSALAVSRKTFSAAFLRGRGEGRQLSKAA